MNITLRSKEYGFERGDVWLLPTDLTGLPSASSELQSILTPAALLDGEIKPTAIAEPGDYSLWIANLVVQRFRDHRRFDVQGFVARLAVAESDVSRGHITLEVEPNGIYQVKLIDREQRALGNRKLTFCGDLMTLEFDLGSDGSTIILGNPTAYWADLEPDNGLVILPV